MIYDPYSTEEEHLNQTADSIRHVVAVWLSERRDTLEMPRRSSRNIWKEGDGDGRKDDPSPKLYDQPPHKIVDKDESTYPPKFVDLSAMWVYRVVRCPFISHEERYARWPHVFPSKGPLRPSWVNKGQAPRIWSDVSTQWVYPVVFNRFQLHGEEGNAKYSID